VERVLGDSEVKEIKKIVMDILVNFMNLDPTSFNSDDFTSDVPSHVGYIPEEEIPEEI
jgi:hypothetical protein